MTMHVSRLHLKNIRGIRDLELTFTKGVEPQASTLLIGRNGTGKSSVLRSIVLGLASEADATALLAEKFGSPFVSEAQKKGTIELDFIDDSDRKHHLVKDIIKEGPTTEMVTSRNGNGLQRSPPLVVALGAGRSNEGASSISTYSIVHSTYMLFDYDGTFLEPELTLRRLKDYLDDDMHYQRVLERIREALGLREEDELDLQRGGGVAVSGPYKENPIPLRSWADGYRITLNWLLDVYAWAMMCEGSIDKQGHVHGILLVDEIEQHLHPLMQRSIIESTKRLFPEMQIVASTHSPLVVQGATLYDIVALYRTDSRIYARLLRDYARHSIEDLFTAEELFNTPPYSIEVEELRDKYRKLVYKENLSTSEEASLRDLAMQLRNLRILPLQPQERSLNQLLNRIGELTDDPC